MHRGLRYLSRQAFEILPQLPRNGIVFSICTFPTIQLGFGGGKARCIMGDMQMGNA